MGTSRLNNRDRLFIRIANDGTAIANSALWRKVIPRGQGRWKDITSCVVGCCGTTEPTESSFIIFQAVTASLGSADITAISFPGYSWAGSLAELVYLVVPLSFDFNETITITTVAQATTKMVASTVDGDGDIAESCTDVSVGGDFTLTVTSTPGTQYLVLLEDGSC